MPRSATHFLDLQHQAERLTQINRDRARELVRSIAKDHGYLGEDVYAQMSPEVRREVEEAMLKKDEMIGSSVITARSLSAVPFVTFRVYRRQIVLECNEDGFTRQNLIAICNVGKSSKAGAQGYIGEKGIGFKSVFMVAWKVRIQSENFSFYFQHRMGDSGMGMISPVWEDTNETLTPPLTRITLFLHETDADEVLSKQRETTLQQFRELQATFLLFMKNLRKIEIVMYDDDNEEVTSTLFSMEHLDQNRVKLKRTTVEGGTVQEDTRHYHVTQDTVYNLAKSENRTYTETELFSHAYSKANIVLAFPLTQDSVPIIEAQDVFAFLPIRNMGFPVAFPRPGIFHNANCVSVLDPV
ncbi:hypothetical protein EYZ11_007587 [Aspergillus tanneri]|uniref:Uncharacterized protein n=1 Tax=Aspergillus tanneri TaxID=1220188 RepID=A0A4V6RQS4_9EURO|nr:hypothetical protein EYZ11_007587 [Aspergillus tanneri]